MLVLALAKFSYQNGQSNSSRPIHKASHISGQGARPSRQAFQKVVKRKLPFGRALTPSGHPVDFMPKTCFYVEALQKHLETHEFQVSSVMGNFVGTY
jgi:hypothetical protein